MRYARGQQDDQYLMFCPEVHEAMQNYTTRTRRTITKDSVTPTNRYR